MSKIHEYPEPEVQREITRGIILASRDVANCVDLIAEHLYVMGDEKDQCPFWCSGEIDHDWFNDIPEGNLRIMLHVALRVLAETGLTLRKSHDFDLVQWIRGHSTLEEGGQ